MLETKTQLKGKITKIFYPKIQFDDINFVIFRIATQKDGIKTGTFSAKGYSSLIRVGQHVILDGKFETDKKGRKAFVFEQISPDLSGRDRNREFLFLILGAVAEKLITYFDTPEKTFEALMKKEDLTKIKGIKEKKQKRIYDLFNRSISLKILYDSFGGVFSIREIKKIMLLFKPEELIKIKENPYPLTIDYFFNFTKVHKCASEKARLNVHDIYGAAIMHVLKQNLNVNVFQVAYQILFKEVGILLNENDMVIQKTIFDKALSNLTRARKTYKGDGVFLIYKVFEEIRFINDYAKACKSIKDYRFTDVDKHIDEYEEEKGFKFSPDQRRAVKGALENKVALITGGPGTGKTTILDCILTIVEKRGINSIALASPTGKAAKRMNEQTKRHASTIHVLLKVDPTKLSLSESLNKFVYHEKNRLPHQMIVIDESSMIDFELGSSLLRAIKDDAKLLFVGDIDQLPPVGYGSTFYEMIRLEVPNFALTETHRQKEGSSIIDIARQINKKSLKEVKNKRDLAFVETVSIENIKTLYIRGMNELQKRGFEDYMDRIVVLTPQNLTGIGTKSINKQLQDIVLGPIQSGEVFVKKNNNEYRVNSKVMQTKNNYETGIINGDVGYIKEFDIENNGFIVEFDDNRRVLYTSDLVDELELAYAMTVHKSQGSEWNYVIQIVSSQHRNNTKQLVYTGITRAKEKIIMLGDKRALYASQMRENVILKPLL